MKNILYFVIILLLTTLFFSCDESINEEEVPTNKKNTTKNIKTVFDHDFEAYIRRKIETELQINAAEKYDLKIHIAQLDKDTISDAVILVNREQHALDRMKKEGKEKLLKNRGYTARENYVFVFKGSSSKLLITPPIGSSIFHPLEVFFEEITTPGQNDFWVEYRFRNSLFRNYYTLKGETLFLTLNCPVFDKIGEKEPEVYSIEHRKVETRLGKDIVIYEGYIPNYDPNLIEDINNYSPENIKPKDEIFVYFIYDIDRKSYVTPMAPREDKKEN
jgi:hypothetical protein